MTRDEQIELVIGGYDVNLQFSIETLEDEGIDMPQTRAALENLRREWKLLKSDKPREESDVVMEDIAEYMIR